MLIEKISKIYKEINPDLVKCSTNVKFNASEYPNQFVIEPSGYSNFITTFVEATTSKVAVVDMTGSMLNRCGIILKVLLQHCFKKIEVTSEDFNFKRIVFAEKKVDAHLIERVIYIEVDNVYEYSLLITVKNPICEDMYLSLDINLMSPKQVKLLLDNIFITNDLTDYCKTKIDDGAGNSVKNVNAEQDKTPLSIEVKLTETKIEAKTVVIPTTQLSPEELYLQKQAAKRAAINANIPKEKNVKRVIIDDKRKFKKSLYHNHLVINELSDKRIVKNGIYEIDVKIKEIIFALTTDSITRIKEVNDFMSKYPDFKFFFNPRWDTVYMYSQEPSLVEESEDGRMVGKIRIPVINPLVWIEGDECEPDMSGSILEKYSHDSTVNEFLSFLNKEMTVRNSDEYCTHLNIEKVGVWAKEKVHDVLNEILTLEKCIAISKRTPLFYLGGYSSDVLLTIRREKIKEFEKLIKSNKGYAYPNDEKIY